jgi:hypothetical protein
VAIVLPTLVSATSGDLGSPSSTSAPSSSNWHVGVGVGVGVGGFALVALAVWGVGAWRRNKHKHQVRSCAYVVPLKGSVLLELRLTRPRGHGCTVVAAWHLRHPLPCLPLAGGPPLQEKVNSPAHGTAIQPSPEPQLTAALPSKHTESAAAEAV